MGIMFTILLVEDDPGIGRTVEFNLIDEGFKTMWVQSVHEARSFYDSHEIDLILLDIGLPDGSGLDFCKHLREASSHIPILILTANIEEEDAVKSFECGADDYIRKPFGISELIARINRHLNIIIKRDIKIKYFELTVFPEKREVYYQNQLLALNRREYDILIYFIKNADKVVTRNELLDHLDIPIDVNDRTIDSHISHLRATLKKTGSDEYKINSVYGVGYKLEKK